jgi:hypothetical protein
MIVIGVDTSDRNIGLNEEAGKYYNAFPIKLNEYSKKYNILIRFIKGTKSHEYDQLKSLNQLVLDNPRFKTIETVSTEYIDIDDELALKVLYIPEEYIENSAEYYKEYFKEAKKEPFDFIFGHGTFDFSGYTNETTTTERHMKNAPTFKSSDFKDYTIACTLFGHVHTCMDKNNVFYAGSFSRDGFGEPEDKGYYEVSYNPYNEECCLDFIVNEDAPTHITIDFDTIKDNDSKKMAKIINRYKEKYDYIRIKASTDVSNESDIEILKNLNKDNIKVEAVNKIIKEDDSTEYDYILKREFDIPTTISKFIENEYKVKINKDKIQEYISKESDTSDEE